MVDWLLTNFLKAFNGTQNDRRQDTTFAIGLTVSCLLLNSFSLWLIANRLRGAELSLKAWASSPWLAAMIAAIALWYSFTLERRAAAKWSQIDSDLLGRGRAALAVMLYGLFSVLLLVGACILASS